MQKMRAVWTKIFKSTVGVQLVSH